MERRAKVELFEYIRGEYEFVVGAISGVTRKLGIHRRTVRQALADARPPDRKRAQGSDQCLIGGSHSSWERWKPTAKHRANIAIPSHQYRPAALPHWLIAN